MSDQTDYAEMRRLLVQMRAALDVLDDANERGDHYLCGQSREQFWHDYWALREAAGDSRQADNDRLRSQLEDREERLRKAAEDFDRWREEAEQRAQTGDPLAPPTHRARARADAFEEALTALRTGRET